MTQGQQFGAKLAACDGNLADPRMCDAPQWTTCTLRRSTIKHTVWRYAFPDGSAYDEYVIKHKFISTTTTEKQS